VTSHGIHHDGSGVETDISPISFGFPALFIIPSILHTHLSPPRLVRGCPDEAAHFHILSLKICGVVFDQTLGWLQNKKFSY
jgi:hypothetical protein